MFLAPVLIVIGVVVKLVLGVEPIDATTWQNAPFGADWPSWLTYTLSAVFAIVVAFLTNQAVQNLGLLGRITNLTMLILAMLFFAIPDAVNHPFAWVLLFIQLALLRIMENLYDEPERATSMLFNAGILVGITAMIIPSSLLLLLVLIHAMIITSSGSVRRVIITCVGAALPFYFYNAGAYLLEWDFILPTFGTNIQLFQSGMSKMEFLGGAFLVFMAFMSLLSVWSVSSSTTLRERRRWIMVIGYLTAGGALIALEGFSEALFIALIPSTIVLARVFLTTRNQRFANALFLIFIAFVLLINS